MKYFVYEADASAQEGPLLSLHIDVNTYLHKYSFKAKKRRVNPPIVLSSLPRISCPLLFQSGDFLLMISTHLVHLLI